MRSKAASPGGAPHRMIRMRVPHRPRRFWQHAARCAIAITSGLTLSSRDVRSRTSGSMSTQRRWAWHAFRITPTSSPEMAARPGLNPLTVEYFCFRDDDLWHAPEHTLVEGAKHELALMKIRSPTGHWRLCGPRIRPTRSSRSAARIHRHDQALARSVPRPVADRPLRHVQIQQPGSRYGHRAAGRANGPRRRQIRSMDGQYRRRIPRTRANTDQLIRTMNPS